MAGVCRHIAVLAVGSLCSELKVLLRAILVALNIFVVKFKETFDGFVEIVG